MRDKELMKLLWERALDIWMLTDIQLEKAQTKRAVMARTAIALVAYSAGVEMEEIRRSLGLRKTGAYHIHHIQKRHQDFRANPGCDIRYSMTIRQLCRIAEIDDVIVATTRKSTLTARERIRRRHAKEKINVC